VEESLIWYQSNPT